MEEKRSITSRIMITRSKPNGMTRGNTDVVLDQGGILKGQEFQEYGNSVECWRWCVDQVCWKCLNHFLMIDSIYKTFWYNYTCSFPGTHSEFSTSRVLHA
jgi:hypothetical protein